ncbi:MAG: hypothetical protein R3250_16935 [Melioribacteraceae bacterium]|nr:hypothetical protein [Melioribacteraceae bacterium]
MSRTRLIGIIVIFCGIAINFIFNNETSNIAAAITIGIGIGVTLTGRLGKKGH